MSDREGRGASRPRRRASGAEAVAQVARAERYRCLVNPFEPLKIFSDEGVEHIHQTALRVLEECGIRVLLPEARQQFAAAGARVDEAEQLVRIDRGLVTGSLALAPPVVTLHARNPQRSVTVGGRHTAIIPVSGPPNVTDRLRGRRAGSLRDYADFVRLSQAFDVIHLLGPCVEAQDIPLAIRHLETSLAQLTLSDKVPFVFSRGTAQVEDCFEMVRLAHGIPVEEFRSRVYCYTNINTNSPRQLDIPMSQGIIDFARAGQLAIITPFTLAGAMAPITLAGALMLAHAEALAGITLAQLVRPGAPVAYGSFTSNVDMKSGSPALGTPEYAKACYGAGQLARHIGLPWRSSNATAANVLDEQAVYESAMSIWGAFLGGCNLLVHGAGWLEGGLTASFEKFIVDVEMLQMQAEMFLPVPESAADIAFGAVAEVLPGGHFFSAEHTLTRFKSAFYVPLLSDWRNFGQWTEDGARTAGDRASQIWQDTLRDFEAPASGAEVRERVASFHARRISEGGAKPVS